MSQPQEIEASFYYQPIPSFNMLNITLTAAQERAVCWLINGLEEAAVCYQFSGGFAGNLHGSLWPLHDIDIDVAQQDLPRLVARMQPYIVEPLGFYEDAEFRLHLLRLQYEGVEIDINQAEGAYGRFEGQWIALDTDLQQRQRVSVLDRRVWVQPLEGLIAYKQLIGRSADVADLRTLQRRAQAHLPSEPC